MSFINPYKDTPKDQLTRLQTYVSRHDYNSIRSIRPQKGTIETLNNTLWKRFLEALTKNGITSYEHSAEFELFVATFEITLPRRPRPSRKSSGGTPDQTA